MNEFTKTKDYTETKYICEECQEETAILYLDKTDKKWKCYKCWLKNRN